MEFSKILVNERYGFSKARRKGDRYDCSDKFFFKVSWNQFNSGAMRPAWVILSWQGKHPAPHTPAHKHVTISVKRCALLGNNRGAWVRGSMGGQLHQLQHPLVWLHSLPCFFHHSYKGGPSWATNDALAMDLKVEGATETQATNTVPSFTFWNMCWAFETLSHPRCL